MKEDDKESKSKKAKDSEPLTDNEKVKRLVAL